MQIICCCRFRSDAPTSRPIEIQPVKILKVYIRPIFRLFLTALKQKISETELPSFEVRHHIIRWGCAIYYPFRCCDLVVSWSFNYLKPFRRHGSRRDSGLCRPYLVLAGSSVQCPNGGSHGNRFAWFLKPGLGSVVPAWKSVPIRQQRHLFPTWARRRRVCFLGSCGMYYFRKHYFSDVWWRFWSACDMMKRDEE